MCKMYSFCVPTNTIVNNFFMITNIMCVYSIVIVFVNLLYSGNIVLYSCNIVL